MAGPRLSKEKRSALRKEIEEQVAAETKLSELVKSLAKKYGIGEPAVRWHHGRVMKGVPQGRRRRKAVVKVVPVVGMKRGRRRKARATRGSGRLPAMKSLLVALRNFSPSELQKAIRKSRVQDRYDTLMVKIQELDREMRGVEKRAAKLKARLARV